VKIRVLTLIPVALCATAGHVGAQDTPLTDDVAEAGQQQAGATEQPLPPNWFEARILMEELAEAGDFEGSLALSELLLQLAEAEFGPESEELAAAHLLIARIQRLSGDFAASETSILQAIETHEAREGPLSPVLIDPFLDLGRTYDEAGDYASAISAYSEARTIGRRNFGLLNEDQIEIIDDMVAAADRLGQQEDAQQLQLEALALVERNHGETSVEAIDARFKYAAWLRSHGAYDEERRHYFEIYRIVEREHDSNPLMLVRALRARAASYRQEDRGDTLGLSGLRESIELLESMPDPPVRLMAEVYLDMGDWHTEFQRASTTGEDYLAAWRLLAGLPDGDEIRREWFDELVVIELPPVSNRGLSTDLSDPIGHVEIHFTVDTAGRTRDIAITSSDPPGLKDSAFMRQYREARFRPRIVNGEFVPVRRARRNEFHYRPLDTDG
jgi:tetratricopeptide (TPR) repeat protein